MHGNLWPSGGARCGVSRPELSPCCGSQGAAASPSSSSAPRGHSEGIPPTAISWVLCASFPGVTAGARSAAVRRAPPRCPPVWPGTTDPALPPAVDGAAAGVSPRRRKRGGCPGGDGGVGGSQHPQGSRPRCGTGRGLPAASLASGVLPVREGGAEGMRCPVAPWETRGGGLEEKRKLRQPVMGDRVPPCRELQSGGLGGLPAEPRACPQHSSSRRE